MQGGDVHEDESLAHELKKLAKYWPIAARSQTPYATGTLMVQITVVDTIEEIENSDANALLACTCHLSEFPEMTSSLIAH